MVKKFLPRLLFLLLIMAGMPKAVPGLLAQNTIGFSPYGFSGMPDTVYAGAQLPVGAFVKNLSPNNAFYDTVTINGYIDTGSANVFFTIPPDSSVYIAPGDSMFFLIPVDFRDTYQGGVFKIGNNTIVVWPASTSSGFSTGDSLVANVFVIDTINGIRPENRETIEVRCYPVPGSGPLFIKSSSPNVKPVSALIYDADGRLVQYADNLSSGIITQTLPTGIYYVEVLFENQQRRTYKIVRY